MKIYIKGLRAGEDALQPAAGPTGPAVETLGRGELLRLVALQVAPCDAAELLAEGVRTAVAADLGFCCLRADHEPPAAPGDAGRASTAEVARIRTVLDLGRPVRLERLEDESSGAHGIETAHDGTERFLAVPVAEPGEPPAAVLAAARPSDASPFSEEEQRTLEHLALQVAPLLARWVEASDDDRTAREHLPTTKLFRESAVDHHAHGDDAAGEPLRISPRWLRWTHVFLFAGIAVAAMATVVLRFPISARGPALLVRSDMYQLAAGVAGNVRAVAVTPGQQAERGQVLVRLEQSRNPLQEPGVREAREISAPDTAWVVDVLVRPGQYVHAGETIALLSQESEPSTIIALLPGRYAPQLQVGLPLHFEASGGTTPQRSLPVESVGATALGPRAALRRLGPLADSIRVTGPQILVEARLPSAESGPGVAARPDGMVGSAEVVIGSERLLFMLLPRLRELLGHG